jgi:hypothetical protein
LKTYTTSFDEKTGEAEVIDKKKKVTLTDDEGHENRGADIEMSDIKVTPDVVDEKKKDPSTVGRHVDTRTRAMKERPDEPADEEVRSTIKFTCSLNFTAPFPSSINSYSSFTLSTDRRNCLRFEKLQ